MNDDAVKKAATAKTARDTRAAKAHQLETENLLMIQAAATIQAIDCAALSVLIFNNGEAPDEWKQLGAEAVQKFMRFGWTAFHAFGGLSTDWNSAAEKMLTKLRADLPAKEQSEPVKKPKRKTGK